MRKPLNSKKGDTDQQTQNYGQKYLFILIDIEIHCVFLGLL